MFRDNKREIFGFRKYKAYGLASAVIAAFFLMGGVASADEVTSASSSDTTAHVVTSPTEVSANNATVVSGNDVLSNNGVVENRAIETPVAAETTQVDSVNSDAVSNNEAPAIEAAPNKKISAVLTVPADKTITASSANDDVTLLDKSKEQVINVNVSGEGVLPEKSRIEIEVSTDVDRGQERVLSDNLMASSATKVVGNENGKVYKSVIDISGLKAGLQKEMIVSPNSFLRPEVTIKPMHRFTTYTLYVGDELISSQKVTETFVSSEPSLKGRSIENKLRVERKANGQTAESFNKGKSDLEVNSRNLNSVYKFELEDKNARLVDPKGLIDFESFRDNATNSYLINYSTLRSSFSSNGVLPIAVDTYQSTKSAYSVSNETRFIDTNLSVTMYYSDEAISNTTDLSSLRSVKTNIPVRTVIEEKISNKGVLQANLALKNPQVNVLDTMSENEVVASIAPPNDGKSYDDTNLPESILKLNLDDKKFKPSSVGVAFYDTNGYASLTDTYKIEVSDADTGVKLGVVSLGPDTNKLVNINLPENVKALKFTPLSSIGVGRNLGSNIQAVDYHVYFKTTVDDAFSWKSELDHSNVKEDHTRYEFQLLNEDSSVAAQTNKTLTIFNKPIVAKLHNNGQSVFVQGNGVYGALHMPFEILNVNQSVFEKLYDISVDESALRKAFKNGSYGLRAVLEGAYIDENNSLKAAFKSKDDEVSGYRIKYSGTLKPGNHVYQIPIKLKPKYDFVKTADSNNVLKDGEVTAVYTLVTYSEYTSIAESSFKTIDSIGDSIYVKNKDLTAVTTVANLTQSDMPHLEAMAYVPKSNLENSTIDTVLAGKVKSIDGWDVLYTMDSISGSYKTDRNLNYVSDVDDYSKVTAVKFVSNRTVRKGDLASFDLKLDYSKDLAMSDSIRYRTVLLTDDDEVLSTPVVAREVKSSPTVVKELFRPDLTDSLTKRLYESLVSDGALFGKTDSLGGALLFDEVSTKISDFKSSTIKSLEARGFKSKSLYPDLSDQIGVFNHHRTEHQNSSDLDSQFANYEANKDLTITNTGEQGSNATIIHYYRATKGNIVERFVDESGNEIKSQVNSGDKIALYDYAEYSHPATIETDKATYEYSIQSGDQPHIVPEGTTTVTYVYRKVADKITYGSVIATYKDTDDNELAPQENVKTDVPDGEAYTTTAKTISSSEVVEKTPEGLTKRTTTSYELIETPANADGNVVGGQTITVPYVYRKNVTVQIYGSVIATYKDEEGNELASTEKVITNQPGGTYYQAAPKDIQGSAQSKVTPEGRTVTITTYKLIKTPDNEHGDVVGGEIIEVPYVYRKNVEERFVPGDAPKVEIPATNVTRYQTEDGTDIKESEQGFVDAPNTIDKYQFTGTTNTNEGGDVQTHIYKLIETEVPGDAPSVEIPELKVTRYQTEDGTDIKDSETGFVDAPNTIGNYQFTGVTNTNEGGDVQTHIYAKIVTEVPGDAPQVDIPELRLTRHISDKGKELLPIEEGSNGPRKTIGDYEYTGRTDVEGGVTTHVYVPIRYEIPGDAPQYDIPESKVTRHVDEKGKELIETEKGTQPPRKTIGENEYTGRTTEKDGITTHVYKPIKHEIPGDAPQYDIPELKVTRHVDEKGKELIETEKGTQPPRKTIRENEYTGRTTEKDGITTHVYKPIKHEVPGDAPQVDVPELKVTRYVNEKGEEIKESEAGFINAPKTIGEYEFTGRTELNDGKDVQTHIYKLVEKPVTPETPSPRTPEPKKPETPQPEAPKPIETPKSNDSKPVVVESVDQPQFVKNELPKTGETNSNLALVGVSLLTALGLIGFVKRKREN